MAKKGAESYVSVVSFDFYLKHQVLWERVEIAVYKVKLHGVVSVTSFLCPSASSPRHYIITFFSRCSNELCTVGCFLTRYFTIFKVLQGKIMIKHSIISTVNSRGD